MLRGFPHTSPWCSPDLLLRISAGVEATGCSSMHAVIRLLSGPFPQLVEGRLLLSVNTPEVRKPGLQGFHVEKASVCPQWLLAEVELDCAAAAAGASRTCA